MDFQNDFVSPVGVGAANGAYASAMAAPTANIPRVIDSARAHGLEIIFVRFLADMCHQMPKPPQYAVPLVVRCDALIALISENIELTVSSAPPTIGAESSRTSRFAALKMTVA